MANIHNHILFILRSRMRNTVTGRWADLHSCKFCDYKSDRSSNLKEHVLRRHEAESGKSRPFACPVCDLKLKSKRDLQRHERRCFASPDEVPDQAQVNSKNPAGKEVSWFRCSNALCLFCLHDMADEFWLDLRFFDKIRYRASFKK